MTGSLRPGIQNSKIGRGIGARSGAPLPPSVVAGNFAIRQLLHEVALAQPPVEQEIFGEEHRHNHLCTVVHIPGLIELPHGGINDRKPGFARAPKFKILPLTRPNHSAKFGVEFHAEHLRKMPQNAEIKLTPDKFADEFLRTLPPASWEIGLPLLTFLEELTDGQQAKTQILGETGCDCSGQSVSTHPVGGEARFQKGLHAGARRLFACLQYAGLGLQAPRFQSRQGQGENTSCRFQITNSAIRAGPCKLCPRPCVGCEDAKWLAGRR